ncbi:MAG: hypothetical protein KF729_16205 [Sandaracinaceae bacterium]|nr:hypothetical protein [Sandaracinaceae bacterium]
MDMRVRAVLALSILAAACGARTELEPLDLDAVLDAAPPECRVDADCDDGVACTEERCVRGRCVRSVRDERCDDGLYCAGEGRCDAALGCVYPGRACDDRVACTVDACDEARRACVAEPRRDLCPLSHRCDPIVGCVARAIVFDPSFLYEVDLPGGAMRRIAPADVSLTDVALHPDGRLFGISTSSLFLLDVDDGRATYLAPLPERAVALDVTPDRELVVAGDGQIYAIDPDTLAVRAITRFPPGMGASGDIAFIDGRMLVTVSDRPGVPSAGPDLLYEVPDDGRAPFAVGLIGFACVWGLAPFGETLYGFTCDGQLLTIDPRTGVGRAIASLEARRIGGAAAR